MLFESGVGVNGLASTPVFLLHGGNVYFSASNDTTYQGAIYRTDGTTAGTVPVVTAISSGTQLTSNLRLNSSHNGYLIFIDQQSLGRELYVTSLTNATTTILNDIDPGWYSSYASTQPFVLTGKKLDQKIYDTFSGYPGGRKEEVARNLINRRPEVVIERAVKGMLPKNRLGRKMYKKLFVYVGTAHPHTAQQPKELKF